MSVYEVKLIDGAGSGNKATIGADGGVKTSGAPFLSVRINTSTTTLVKTGPGTLKRITVGIKGTIGTIASLVTIYDNIVAAGTIIGVIDSLTLSGSFEFDVDFSTGLTIVTTGTVAPDITVIYR